MSGLNDGEDASLLGNIQDSGQLWFVYQANRLDLPRYIGSAAINGI